MSELQRVAPEMALQIYLEQREDEVSRQTLQSHRYRLEPFVEWCDKQGISSMSDITGMDLHKFRVYRREEDGLKTVSLQGQLSTLRQFLRVAASVDAVPENLHEKVLLPTVSKSEQANEEMLTKTRADAALEYLDRYHYASRRHVELLILWRTSMRRGGLRALDLGDFDPEEPALELRHRPPETPLKNGEWSNRDVFLLDEVAEVLEDYIDGPREDIEDDQGRFPLFTTANGRVALGTIKQDMYQITRPCMYGIECPHDRDPDTCEAVETRRASTCPSSRSPHMVRTGSVTAHLDDGSPKSFLGDRVDMTEDTMEDHYDQAGERERMMRRRNYISEDV